MSKTKYMFEDKMIGELEEVCKRLNKISKADGSKWIVNHPWTRERISYAVNSSCNFPTLSAPGSSQQLDQNQQYFRDDSFSNRLNDLVTRPAEAKKLFAELEINSGLAAIVVSEKLPKIKECRLITAHLGLCLYSNLP